MSPRLKLFKLVVQESGVDPEFAANIIIQKFTELKRDGIDCDSIAEDEVIALFDAYHNGAITKQALDPLLRELAKGGKDVMALIEKLKLKKLSGSALRNCLEGEGQEQGGDRKELMSKYRLVVDGLDLNDALGRQSK